MRKTFNKKDYSTEKDFFLDPSNQLWSTNEDSKTDYFKYVTSVIKQFETDVDRKTRKTVLFSSEEDARKYYDKNIKNSVVYKYYRCFFTLEHIYKTSLEQLKRSEDYEDLRKSLNPTYVMLLV